MYNAQGRREKYLTNRAYKNFDEQNFDELNVGFIGETLREKETLFKLSAIHHISQTLTHS